MKRKKEEEEEQERTTIIRRRRSSFEERYELIMQRCKICDMYLNKCDVIECQVCGTRYHCECVRINLNRLNFNSNSSDDTYPKLQNVEFKCSRCSCLMEPEITYTFSLSLMDSTTTGIEFKIRYQLKEELDLIELAELRTQEQEAEAEEENDQIVTNENYTNNALIRIPHNGFGRRSTLFAPRQCVCRGEALMPTLNKLCIQCAQCQAWFHLVCILANNSYSNIPSNSFIFQWLEQLCIEYCSSTKSNRVITSSYYTDSVKPLSFILSNYSSDTTPPSPFRCMYCLCSSSTNSLISANITIPSVDVFDWTSFTHLPNVVQDSTILTPPPIIFQSLLVSQVTNSSTTNRNSNNKGKQKKRNIINFLSSRSTSNIFNHTTTVNSIHHIPTLSSETPNLKLNHTLQLSSLSPSHLTGHAPWIISSVPHSSLLAIGTSGGCVVIFNPNTVPYSSTVIRTSCLDVSVVVPITRDTFVTCGWGEGALPVYNISTQQCKTVLTGHSEAVRTIIGLHQNMLTADYTNNDNVELILSGSYDGSLKLWDLRAGSSAVQTWKNVHKGEKIVEIKQVHHSCWNSPTILTLGHDRTLNIFDLRMTPTTTTSSTTSTSQTTPNSNVLVPVSQLHFDKFYTSSFEMIPINAGNKYAGMTILNSIGKAIIVDVLRMMSRNETEIQIVQQFDGQVNWCWATQRVKVSKEGRWVTMGSENGRVLMWDLQAKGQKGGIVKGGEGIHLASEHEIWECEFGEEGGMWDGTVWAVSQDGSISNWKRTKND